MANGPDRLTTTLAPGAAPARDADVRPFVGRTHEIAELDAALADAAGGRGGFVLITGESGSGKTRLTEETTRSAERRGFTVLSGRAWDGGGAPAFWPWVQILRQVERAEGTPAGAAAALAALERPSAGDSSGLHATDTLDPERARFELFVRIADVLRSFTEHAPALVVIDDLQAADDDSILLLRLIARDAGRMPLLLIATFADAPLAAGTERGSIHEIAHDATHLPLRGLSAAETADLLTRLVLGAGGDLAPPIDAATIARVFEITEGSPLFVVEAVRLWRAEGRFDTAGRLQSDGLALPGRIRELFQRRVARLPPDARALLDAASVLGREFDATLLERTVDSVPPSDALDTILQADLLREIRFLPKRYAFSHGLLRETLYGELAPVERTRLHRRAAAAIEHLFGDDLSAHLADVAHHLTRAGADGDVEDAIAYSARAAEQAVAVRAYEDAVSLTAQTLGLLDAERLPRRGSRRRRCTLLIAHGQALHAAGHRSRALATFGRAAELARELGDGELLAEAALGCAGGWTGFLEVAKFDRGDRETSRRLQDLLREALDLLEDRRPALRARLLSRLAVEQIHTASVAERDDLTEEAVGIARRANDPALLAAVLCDRHLALWVPDTLYERLAATQEILGLAETTGDATLKLMALAWHVGDSLEAGEDVGLEGKLELFGRLADAYRQPAFVWGYKVHRAMRAMLRGDFERARELSRDAFRIGRNATATALVAYGLQMRSLWQLVGDDAQLASTEPTLRGAAELFADLPSVRLEVVQLCLQLGRGPEARVEWEKIAAHGFDDVPDDNNRLFCLVGMGDACVALADRPRARLLYEKLLPYAEQHAVSAFTAVCLGSVARCLGGLAQLQADWPAADAHYALALRRNLALDARPWAARTRLEHAAMLAARAGDERRAASLAADAAAEARALGMSRLAADADALLARLGGAERAAASARIETEPVAPSPAPAPSPVSAECLFRRDGDIWTIRFDARGCSIKDMRGLHYLAELLRHPGREIHAADIMRATNDTTTGPKPLDGSLHVAADLGDAGEKLDGTAMHQYRRRLVELREDLEDAELRNDLGRMERARDEIAFLTTELSAAGRRRRSASHAERARLTVTRGIKSVLQKIQTVHPTLARHLQATVRRGYYCTYMPDPRHPITWQL